MVAIKLLDYKLEKELLYSYMENQKKPPFQ